MNHSYGILTLKTLPYLLPKRKLRKEINYNTINKNSKSASRTLQPETRIPIIIIQGPTAVGKSTLANKLALELHTEIISADSRQVYKYLNIGTAKPSKEIQKKIKHHLIDIVYPDEEYSAGDFVKDSEKLIYELHKKDKLPLIVGGTGFYIKALLEGIFKAPSIPREIREKLIHSAEEKNSDYLYEYLREKDPSSAERTNPNDLHRIIRALEVYEATGKTITQLWQENPSDKKYFKTFNILISEDREILYNRINHRVDDMIKNGLLNEMKELLEKGYNEKSPGMNTVGYKELLPYFEEKTNLEGCSQEIKKNTRNYAKRQFTWYRKIDFDLTLQASNINFSIILQKIREFKSLENWEIK